MPELPEVETVVRSLGPRLIGQRIESVRVLFRPLLRQSHPLALQALKGARILGLRRRGKMVLLDATNGLSLLLHLKMTGRLLLCPKEKTLGKHTRLIIALGDEEELRFEDSRKFGFVRLIKTEKAEEAAELKSLGPEPLELGMKRFCELLHHRRGRLKSLLINQSFLAGIGNIYADEICFEARLHPSTEVSRLGHREKRRLWSAIRTVLTNAVAARGTSIRDFRDGEGREGGFQAFLRVYGQEGEACFFCGARIKRLRLAGRSTHFCPRCQRKGRSSVSS